MVNGLLAALGVALGTAGNLGNGGGQLLNGAGLLGSALRQGLGAGGHLVGAGGNLLAAEVNLGQGVAEAAVDDADGLQHAAQLADIQLLRLGAAVEVAVAHLLQKAAGILDHAVQSVLAASQCVAHFAQLTLALIVHRDVQLALAEAHQGDPDLLHRDHDALDDDERKPDHHEGRNDHRYNDGNDRDHGNRVLPLNDLRLFRLEPRGQRIAGGGGLGQGGRAGGYDHIGGLLLVRPGRLANFFGLGLPVLHQRDKVVQLRLILQGINAVQLCQLRFQLADFAVGCVNAAHVAG